MRPKADGPPVKVECDLYIIDFGSISEMDMDYTMDIYLSQKWIDTRLAYGHSASVQPIILNRKLIPKVWNPDIFFPHEKKASYHNVPVPNVRMRVYGNGTVVYSYRVTLTVACPMDLTNFPMDKQRCKLVIESFTYEARDVILTWSSSPIGMEVGLELPRFNLTSLKSSECREQHYKIGDFSCLKAVFHLRRQYGYFLLQTYTPTSMIVMISWLSFWINKNSEPARVGICVGTVLTMATQLASTKNSIPRISYPKALDVWLTSCMFFVYSAMIEYALVNTLTRIQKRRKEVMEKDAEKRALLENDGFSAHKADRSSDRVYSPRLRKRLDSLKGVGQDPEQLQDYAQIVDTSSRFLFPFVFVCYNMFYWIYYSS